MNDGQMDGDRIIGVTSDDRKSGTRPRLFSGGYSGVANDGGGVQRLSVFRAVRKVGDFSLGGYRRGAHGVGAGGGKGSAMASLVISKVESRAMLFASLCVLAFAYWINLPPTAYSDVEVLRVEREGNTVEVVASFTKGDCDFKRLEVVGSVIGETRFLRWRDLDGPSLNEDRSAGHQTLRISFDAPPDVYDWVEIRTQHFCDGKKVDKVFYRLEPLI